MPDNPAQPLSGAASRAEKMSVLSALLGPEALAKLRAGQPDPLPLDKEIDADRIAWHRNRLLKRLRSQPGDLTEREAAGHRTGNIVAGDQAPPLPQVSRSEVNARQQSQEKSGLDKRLSAIADPGNLEQEHPAVIARLMTRLSREERIIAFKSLPGPIARSVVRRLK